MKNSLRNLSTIVIAGLLCLLLVPCMRLSHDDIVDVESVQETVSNDVEVVEPIANIEPMEKLVVTAGVSSVFMEVLDNLEEGVESSTESVGELPSSLKAFEVVDESSIDLASIDDLETDIVTMSNPQLLLTIPSIDIINYRGHEVATEEITVNVDMLLEQYYLEKESPEWDTKDRTRTLRVLWNFLVKQNNVPVTNAAGILGNIYIEGNFAQEQGTGKIFESIEDARKVLGKGGRGYGCVQWTYYERQKNLLKYYEAVHKLIPDDWEATVIIAESCCLLEELRIYHIFEDIHEELSLEDATGRVALNYESYKGCSKDWSVSDKGVHSLKSNSGSGSKRVKFAKNIYNYFME